MKALIKIILVHIYENFARFKFRLVKMNIATPSHGVFTQSFDCVLPRDLVNVKLTVVQLHSQWDKFSWRKLRVENIWDFSCSINWIQPTPCNLFSEVTQPKIYKFFINLKFSRNLHYVIYTILDLNFQVYIYLKVCVITQSLKTFANISHYNLTLNLVSIRCKTRIRK